MIDVGGGYYINDSGEMVYMGESQTEAQRQAQQSQEQSNPDIGQNVPGAPDYQPEPPPNPIQSQQATTYEMPQDQAEALGYPEDTGLTDAQKAGIEATQAGEVSNPAIGQGIPVAPDYQTEQPSTQTGTRYELPEEQAKALGVPVGAALTEAQYKGLQADYQAKIEAQRVAIEKLTPYITTLGQRVAIGTDGKPITEALPPKVIFNLAQFLQDHPEDGEKLLKDAWFTDETIEQAKASRKLLPFYDKSDGTYDIARYFKTVGVDIDVSSPVQKPNLDKIHKAEQNLREAGFSDEDIANARFAAFSSGTTIGGKAIPKPLGIFGDAQLKMTNWADGLRKDALERSKGYSPLGSQLSQGASGVAVAAITFLPASALMLGNALTHPTQIPTMAKQMVDGVKYSVKTIVNPLSAPYDIAYHTFNTGMLAGSAVIGGIGAVSKMNVWVSPKGLPTSLIGKEASTGRIPLGEIDPIALGKAMGEVQRQAMEPGAPRIQGTVAVEGTNYNLNYLKTPAQQKIGNIVWHGTNEGLDSLIRGNEIKAGSDGLYTDPWAAIQYTRAGNGEPGLVMIITDASKVKDVPVKTLGNVSQSSNFIEAQAKPGLYSPSKIWRGDFETEIVAAPGTKFNVPEPTADIYTRVIAGKTSDFFTYDDGHYLPIKVAVDQSLVDSGKAISIPKTSDIYAVKLLAFQNAFQNFVAGVKHPDLAISDLLKGISSPKDVLDASVAPGRGISPPGVRDVYLVNNWGARLKALGQDILDAVSKRAKEEKIDPLTKEGRAELDRLYREEYSSRVAQIITSSPIANEYQSSPELRQKFEDLYIQNLSTAVEAEAKTEAETIESMRDVLRETAIDQSRNAPSENRTTSSSDSSTPTSESRQGESERTIPESENIPTSSETPLEESVPPTVSENPPPPSDEPPPPSENPPPPSDNPPPPSENPPPPIEESPPEERTPPPPIEEPNPPQFPRGDKEGRKEVEQNPPPGTVVWVQGRPNGGAMYKYIVPPYRDTDMYTTRRPLKGYVDEGFTGEGAAKKSLKIVGGAPPTDIRNVDLGFVRINITLESGKPKISYVPDEDANVGERSKTIGMGEGQIPIEEWKQKIQNEKVVARTEPTEEIEGTGRIKKPKDMKDWWDTDFYNIEPTPLPPTRTYRGHEIVPPNLGGEL